MKRLLTALALFLLTLAAHAEIYQCRDVTGCVATIHDDQGNQRKVIFRKGDVVSTDAGWVVSTDDGWYRLRTRNNGHAPRHPWYMWWAWWDPNVRRSYIPFGWLGIWNTHLEGWSMCECNRFPVCRVVLWDGSGIKTVEYGEAWNPSNLLFTPLFLREGDWIWHSGWF